MKNHSHQIWVVLSIYIQCLDSNNNIDSRIKKTTFFTRHVSSVRPSSSVLHVKFSLNRAQCYKVRHFALTIVMFMCFTCWLRSGLVGFLKLNLKLSSRRVQDHEAIRCAGWSKSPWTLQMSKHVRRPVGK